MLSKNTKETAQIAKTFLSSILKDKALQPGALVVGLSGNLGAGKTAFTQAVATHLGVKDTVNSPTFVIMKKYPVKLLGYTFLFHLDAYRLKNEQELLHLGWEEIISKKEHLVFVEWPENISKVLPPDARFVSIVIDKNGHRTLELK